MASFQTSLTFLNLNQEVVVNTLGTESINLSSSHIKDHYIYSKEKSDYLCQKILKPKNGQKVNENIHELEHLFSSHRCLHLQWEGQNTILLFFNSGTIASLTFDEKKLNILKIVTDSSLCGKLVSDHITDVILNENFLLICYSEPKLTYVHIGKHFPNFPSKLLGQKKGKILGFEPKLTTVDVIGPSSRRLEKKLSLNNLKDCVLIWWRFTTSDVWPWMPVNYSVDRVNMIMYVLNDSAIEVLCSAKVHGELVHATFSKWHSNRILTLEEITDGDVCHVNICYYEIICGRCQCTSLSKLPLHGHLTAFDWSLLEDKLLLCDKENSLLIYDVNKNTTLVANTLFLAKEIVWHPSGMLAAVIGSHGCLQCFDTALTMIKLEIYGAESESSAVIDLGKLLYPQRLVQNMLWQSTNSKSSVFGASDACNEISNTILTYFEHGIIILVNFTFGCLTKNILSPLELISQYLKCGSINEAVCLLQCLNWCQQAELCYQCLSKIVNFLLRKPMSSQIESALELSLGTFYNSASNLTETILYDYHQQIDHIARRFFHSLLRYHRFEKAFLLAVDLQFRDLFLDLHHVAKQKNETMLAIVALKHAEELETSDTSSYDQSDAFEGSDRSSSCSPPPSMQKELYPISNSSHPNNHLAQSGFEHCSKQPLNVQNESVPSDLTRASSEEISRYNEYETNFCKSLLCRNIKNCDPSYIPGKFLASDFSFTNSTSTLNKNLRPSVNMNLEHSVTNSIQKLSIFKEHDEHNLSNPAMKSHSPVQSESFDEDEENVGEKKVKFVHFGVV